MNILRVEHAQKGGQIYSQMKKNVRKQNYYKCCKDKNLDGWMGVNDVIRIANINKKASDSCNFGLGG